MKTLIIFLMFTGLVNAHAQQRKFTATCPDLTQKLQLIKQSLTDMGKLKKGPQDKNGNYACTVSLCGANGVLEIDPRYSVLTYEFPYDSFALEKDYEKIVEAFVKNFRQAANAVFGTTYEETADTHDDELWGKSKSYTYRPFTRPYPTIDIQYPFADCYVRISFENYK